MEQEVDTLLRKEAIKVVPPRNRESGFYSRYFIILKNGGFSLILDLKLLNQVQDVHVNQVQDAYYQASRVSNQV